MAFTQILQETFENKLESNTLNTLKDVARLKTYPPKTKLCHQGEIEETFYIIVKGRVASSQKLENGESRLLGMHGPNEYFGEVGLIDDRPRMASCTTMSDTTVLEVTKDVFNSLVKESPIVAFALSKHILASMRRLDDLAINDLRDINKELQDAYDELKAAQVKLVEKKRLEHELKLAADVQKSLLPGDLPQYSDYSFVAHLEPARVVGGDFYDVIPLDDENVGLLIADVADKGIHAAMLMGVARTLFFTEARRSLSPSVVAESVHKYLMRVAPSMDVFITAFYGVLHRPSGLLTYVRAGHEQPLLFRPGQPVEYLTSTGRFLGMVEDLELKEHTFQLQPDDRLVLYSDGLPDATNHEGERFGHEHFEHCLETNGHLTAAGLVQCLVNDVADWCKEELSFDDLTLLVLEVK